MVRGMETAAVQLTYGPFGPYQMTAGDAHTANQTAQPLSRSAATHIRRPIGNAAPRSHMQASNSLRFAYGNLPFGGYSQVARCNRLRSDVQRGATGRTRAVLSGQRLPALARRSCLSQHREHVACRSRYHQSSRADLLASMLPPIGISLLFERHGVKFVIVLLCSLIAVSPFAPGQTMSLKGASVSEDNFGIFLDVSFRLPKTRLENLVTLRARVTLVVRTNFLR